MSIEFNRTYHSPINNSSSKQLYSFSKASRFQPTIKSECKTSFYETKRGAFQKRSTSFGFGNKVQFASTEGVPHGGAYNKNSDFSVNKIKKRGFSFGIQEDRSLIDNPQQKRRFPGPGSYISINEKHKCGFGRSFQNVSFSIRGKYDDPLLKDGNQLGPGHYQNHGVLSARGNYSNSKYANSKSPIVGKDSRFELQKVQTPGPGHYKGEQKINMNGTGTYFHSKYATTKASSFGHSQRPSPAKPYQAPDPGAYTKFSQFALRTNDWKSHVFSK